MAYFYLAERRSAMAVGSNVSTQPISLRNQMGYKVCNMASMRRPAMEINLDKADGAWATSYSTMDTISGTVTITATNDTRFDDIDIAFIGEAKTHVERLTATPSVSGQAEASHRFLTLKQPINNAELPYPRVLQAGKTYTFSFTFNVPAQMLPRACTHPVASDHVRQMHLMLPPSLGDAELAGHSGKLMDDFAPEMSRIQYSVRAKVTQVREMDGSPFLIADKSKKVHVKPAFEEQPPLNIDCKDSEYRIRVEKSIKKGMFKGKSGTLIMQSPQPKPLVIPGARTSSAHCPITTIAKVLLRFDPADEKSTPPKLGSLTSKMKISTFFASTTRQNFPSRSALGFDLTQGLYQESISLSSLCVESAQWEKHLASPNPSNPTLSRRDSGISDSSRSTSTVSHDSLSETHFHQYMATGILSPSKHYHGSTFYTAQILVPITIPSTKSFIPTFHSCLISRVYALNLTLTVHAPGVTHPSMTLKVPVQVCAEGSASGTENARVREVEMGAVREVEDVFRPRSVAPTGMQVGVRMDSGVGDEAPPEYMAWGHNVRIHV
ncbi:arrestin [Delitschia confertaspora ATCC 74209]|uniref:Arrestin n=1 Tax=Delitschia confertaspora ATCC 74209 TaxID=1513339 RepID=A0A9P4JJ74_9PLEO|nr:arrestin [Delitschia confertaspora ATCC 74209]